MYWIALSPSHEDERTAWGWRALAFTPRVAWLDEALVLEISATQRLWGGRRKLLRRLLDTGEALTPSLWAAGATGQIALALLRLKTRGEEAPVAIPDGLPIDTLTAAQPHAGILERMGCRTWAQLRALPRAGVARRFGAELVAALDRAYGEAPETLPWLGLPESFDVKFELASLATSAPELMWTAQRLLYQLQLWLAARNRGVLAIELEWTLDLRRLNGKPLPPTETLQVKTARPTQDMAHLRRLVNEHLSRTRLAAPANHLRIRTIETVPWGGLPASLLPEDNKPGERLHEFVERLSVRLGEGNVLVCMEHEDHRPERMESWMPAKGHALPTGEGARVSGACDALYPTWILPKPVPLAMKGDSPCYGGPLRFVARLYRIETAWWEEGGPACRDYFIARSDEAGLVWIYRERLAAGDDSPHWYLQGLYA
jgi:protein ImuB